MKHTRKKAFKNILRSMPPARIIALGFLGVILLGAALLCLPAAAKDGRPTDFLTSLFTATSATCVTGLILVDTGLHWTTFGHTVILLLIQIGGLGFMSIACVFLMALRQRISLRQQLVLAQALSISDYSTIFSMVRRILLGTFCAEALGAVILTLRFWPEFGFGKALWYGVFHSVSAFCNAGFDILGDTAYGGSLCRYVADPVVNLTVIALIIGSGLGFAVWGELFSKRKWGRLSVYARLVLIITGLLVVFGAGILAALEWNNPQTIGELSAPKKLLAALFQSVTLRTAGFASFNQDAMGSVSKAVCDVLMLIGGSSGSTAGGVKTVTVGIILLSAVSAARGQSSVQVFHHSVSSKDITNAVSLCVMVLVLAFTGAVLIGVLSGVSFENAIFETFSALCTVGLTTGITPSLDLVSRLILIVFMFFGRVGIMTISVGFLAADPAEARVRYADTNLLIG